MVPEPEGEIHCSEAGLGQIAIVLTSMLAKQM